MKMFSFGNTTEELQTAYKSVKIGGMSAPKIITGTLDVIDKVKGHKAYQKFKDLISNKENFLKKLIKVEQIYDAIRTKKGEILRSIGLDWLDLASEKKGFLKILQVT